MDVPTDQSVCDRAATTPRLVRILARWALLIASVLAVALIHPGCSSAKHYRTLSLFFDGVPVPDGVEPRPNARRHNQGWDDDSDPAQQAQRQQAQQAAAEPKIVYLFHQPYEKRDCFGCHDQGGSYQAPASPSKTCQRCHEDYFKVEPGDWVHGPVAQLECRRCHEPHKSVQRALLTNEQTALCLDCHEQELIYAAPQHAANRQTACSECHDPHAAGNHALLADSRTYARRPRMQRGVVSAHSAWSKEDCSRCHETGQSNALKQNVDGICLECHTPIAQQMASSEPMHEAVKSGKCTACHTPHRSSLPSLIRPTAEKICFTCHKLEDLQTPKHPRVQRADCLLCHVGHGSGQQHLLRDEHVQAAEPTTQGEGS